MLASTTPGSSDYPPPPSLGGWGVFSKYQATVQFSPVTDKGKDKIMYSLIEITLSIIEVAQYYKEKKYINKIRNPNTYLNILYGTYFYNEIRLSSRHST